MIKKLLAVLVAGAFVLAIPACDKKAEGTKTEAAAGDKKEEKKEGAGDEEKKEEKKEEAAE